MPVDLQTHFTCETGIEPEHTDTHARACTVPAEIERKTVQSVGWCAERRKKVNDGDADSYTYGTPEWQRWP